MSPFDVRTDGQLRTLKPGDEMEITYSWWTLLLRVIAGKGLVVKVRYKGPAS